jgi:hypothetical protein
MNLYKLFISAVFTVIITYIVTVMYIGNKLILKVLDKNVIYSPLLEQSHILPGFGFYYENSSSIPIHYRNISMPMKISLLLLSL